MEIATGSNRVGARAYRPKGENRSEPGQDNAELQWKLQTAAPLRANKS
jgi:hypothetical protein